MSARRLSRRDRRAGITSRTTNANWAAYQRRTRRLKLIRFWVPWIVLAALCVIYVWINQH